MTIDKTTEGTLAFLLLLPLAWVIWVWVVSRFSCLRTVRLAQRMRTNWNFR